MYFSKLRFSWKSWTKKIAAPHICILLHKIFFITVLLIIESKIDGSPSSSKISNLKPVCHMVPSTGHLQSATQRQIALNYKDGLPLLFRLLGAELLPLLLHRLLIFLTTKCAVPTAGPNDGKRDNSCCSKSTPSTTPCGTCKKRRPPCCTTQRSMTSPAWKRKN